jgi:hypothetical protein
MCVMAAESCEICLSLRRRRAEGRAEMKALLGGKGANLAEMANLGLPVPPGFTITTEVCTAYYANGRAYPHGLESQVERLPRVEAIPSGRSSATRQAACCSRCAPAPAPPCRA